MPDPADTTASLNNRARAYLHTNCSQCHRPSGPTPSTMDLRYTTPLSGNERVRRLRRSPAIWASARTRDSSHPASAANSIIVNRDESARHATACRRSAPTSVDSAGVALLTQWINALSGC